MDQLGLNSSLPSLDTNSAANTASVGRPAKELGQADFIELLVAQIKNQDPTKPLDPSQFMNQLAQFSTVNGIQELKSSFDSLAPVVEVDNRSPRIEGTSWNRVGRPRAERIRRLAWPRGAGSPGRCSPGARRVAGRRRPSAATRTPARRR